MDYLTNYSLKYAELEDDSVTSNRKFVHENTSEPSSKIQSPMMFSRQSSLDSLPTLSVSTNGHSVASYCSYYISSSISPSDIPDSPSELMPQQSDIMELKSPHQESNYVSPLDDDECDKDLLEHCLNLGIKAMIRPGNDDHHRSVNFREHLLEDDGSEIDSKLLDECWRNGIKSFNRRKLSS